ALTAAGSGRTMPSGGSAKGAADSSGNGVSHDEAEGERDARAEASDPALAALAAALLPGSVQPSAAGAGGEDADAQGLAISARSRSGVSGSGASLDAQIDDALDASSGLKGDEPEPATGRD